MKYQCCSPPEGEGAWISTFVLVSLPSTLSINGALINRAWSGNRSSEGRSLACGLHSDPALTHIHNLFTSHNPFNLFRICRATSGRVRHNVLVVIHLPHVFHLINSEWKNGNFICQYTVKTDIFPNSTVHKDLTMGSRLLAKFKNENCPKASRILKICNSFHWIS